VPFSNFVQSTFVSPQEPVVRLKRKKIFSVNFWEKNNKEEFLFFVRLITAGGENLKVKEEMPFAGTKLLIRKIIVFRKID